MTSSWYDIPFQTYRLRRFGLRSWSMRRMCRKNLFIVPLTSRTMSLLLGEFLLIEWRAAGLNVPTVVKRGLYTVHETLIIKTVGRLLPLDADQLEGSL
jgi:hypothetical protein